MYFKNKAIKKFTALKPIKRHRRKLERFQVYTNSRVVKNKSLKYSSIELFKPTVRNLDLTSKRQALKFVDDFIASKQMILNFQASNKTVKIHMCEEGTRKE